jgi:xanthine dehydrogenase YagT iron-sulfur-binding subunit
MPDDSPKPPSSTRLELTRRSFLESVGAATVAAAIDCTTAARAEAASPQAGELIWVQFQVNGVQRTALVEPRWSLMHVLRETLEMTGTRQGCERGECGACTVLIDGIPRYSCLTLAVEADGHSITTIEGLLKGEDLGPVQKAFAEQDAFQCGYCTSGQILSAEGLLRRVPDPTDDEIRLAMSGNLCRCGAYVHIHRAIRQAAALRKSQGGAL